jgi:hypothetical protein
MEGTKLSFIRALLNNEKQSIKSADVVHMAIPNYPEISVKNLYEDVMQDPVVSKYLPSMKQCSNKLPEREFFFSILATIKT